MAARTVEIAFLGNTKELEVALERAGLVAKGSGDAIGDAFNSGSTKAGNALEKLGKKAEGLGIPFASGLSVAGKHLDEANTKTGKLTTVMSELGKVSLLAGGAIAVGVGVEAVKMGEQYQSAQAKIQGATGQSTKAVEQLTHAFGSTAGKFESSGEEMESAYAGVAGQLQATEGHALGTAEAMKVMSSATELNTAVQGNLAETTSALSAVMQAFHLSASQASGTADTLYNVSTRLNVPISSLSTAMDKLHARLGTLSPTLSDMGALMVSLGEHGVTGSRGVQVVNTAFQTLVGGSSKVKEMLGALGVNIFDAQGKFIGMQNVIAQLQPKLAGLSQQQQIFAEKTLFGAGASQIMGQVIQSGVPAYQKATAEATKMGTAHEAAAKQAKTLHGELETAKAAVETLGGDLGLILIPKLTAVAKALAEGITWLTKHKEAAIALGAVIAGPLALAVAVYAEQKAVAFARATQTMISDITSLAAKITGSSATIEASEAAQGAAATSAAATTGTAEATMAADTEATAAKMQMSFGEIDTGFATMGTTAEATATTVDTANTTMGASFVGLLAKINPVIAAIAAVAAAEPLINKLTGGGLSESGSTEKAAMHKAAEAQGPIKGGYSKAGGVEGEILNYFMSKGFSPNAAAGIVGNVKLESSLNPQEPGGGLFQDTKGRGAGQGADTKQQLEAAFNEMRTTYHGVFEQIQKAKSPQEAAKLFETGFETPEGYNQPGEGGTAHSLQRERAAAEARRHIESTGGGAAAGGAGGGSSAVGNIMRETGESKAAKEAEKEKKKLAAALGVPAGVTTMLSTAQALLGAPYTSGGGHGASTYDPIEALKKIGVDCSGFVSRVLASGGVPGVQGLTTEGLPGKLAKGAGRYVTVADRPSGPEAHTLIDILGKWFESGGKAGGGVKALSAKQSSEELAGGGFQMFHPAGLNAPVAGGANEATLKAGTAIEAAISKQLEGLTKSAETLLKKYEAEEQSGTPTALEKALGVSTTGKYARIPGLTETAAQTAATGGKPFTPLTHELGVSAGASVAGKQFQTLVDSLRATHEKKLEELASKLVAAHKTALDELARGMVALQAEKDAEGLKLQAIELKDQTTATEHYAAAQLTVVKDEQQQAANAAKAGAQQVTDATQSMSDSFSALTQSIEDQTKVMADSSNAVVEGIKDQTNIEVSVLGERGLYGLNLIAQKQEVQLDEMKASYDQQIVQAQIAEDSSKGTWTQVVAQKQQIADETKQQADTQIAQAQAHADSVTITQDQLEARAQSTLDAVQAHADAQDQLKQLIVTADANAPANVKKQAEAALHVTEHRGELEIAGAGANLAAVTATANSLIEQAKGQLTATQSYWAQMEAAAQQAVAQAQGESAQALAKAQQGLQSIEDKAAQEEARVEKEVAVTKERSQTQYAGSGLQINVDGPMIQGNNLSPAETATEIGWQLRNLVPSYAS